MITIKTKGSFKRTHKFLKRLDEKDFLRNLEKYGEAGVEALAANTPVDTGKTAESWDYQIVEGNGYVSVQWFNTNIVDGVPIAVILQYGHGTRNGGYVKGRDYINPAMKSVFDKIAEDAWAEVVKS